MIPFRIAAALAGAGLCTSAPDLPQAPEPLQRDPAAATLPLSPVGPGDVVVTEFMKDPSAVSDGAGEWIEIHNLLPWRVDVEGMVVAGSANEQFVLDNGGAGILIGPGGFFVMGNNADTGTNGGVEVDYEYSGFSLKNSADEIRLFAPGGQALDIVRYDDGVDWPDTSGMSISLDPSAFDPLVNDDPAHWCHASTVMPSGDTGTPGEWNDSCP